MYVAVVPNRSSPPAVLLRESYRENGKVKNRTLANLSHWPAEQVEALRQVLKGAGGVAAADAFDIVRSLPHGHVTAVLGTLRRLGLESLLEARSSRRRRLAVAMIVARLLDPVSKLATARALHGETTHSSLSSMLQLEGADEDELYAAMDWLLGRQPAVEQALAQRHLGEGGLVLYDLTSSWFEGRHCPLARRGYSRDGQSGKLQIVFGLLTNAAGCPVAVEVWEGNTADPKTLPAQVQKLRQRFGLRQVVVVGDRGMVTQARLREDFQGTQLSWITALRANSIQKLAAGGALQRSLFDQRDLAEITHPDYPHERLIACYNPLLAEQRRRKRNELLQATEKELEKIQAATQRRRQPLRGRPNIAWRVGQVLGRFQVGKHFEIQIEENALRWQRRQARIEQEQSLDGIYVIRTNVGAETLDGAEVVRSYKRLSGVERAFRSLKTVDLRVRPIHHRLPDRVRAHIFLCLLAYYVEWHMRQRLAPLLFDDHDKAAAEAQRSSVVGPARRSAAAERKARTKRTAAGGAVHSFRSLLADLATLTLNRIQPRNKALPAFDKLATPTSLQLTAFDLLGVTPKLSAV